MFLHLKAHRLYMTQPHGWVHGSRMRAHSARVSNFGAATCIAVPHDANKTIRWHSDESGVQTAEVRYTEVIMHMIKMHQHSLCRGFLMGVNN